MAKFKITVPTTGARGADMTKAGVRFVAGCAEVDTATDAGVRALSYFRSAGYGVEPLDDVSVDDAIREATVTPEQEAAELRAEIATLSDAAEVDKLRAERDALRGRLADQRAERQAVADEAPAPPESNRAEDWRPFAVAHMGMSEAEARTYNGAELREIYGKRTEGGAA